MIKEQQIKERTTKNAEEGYASWLDKPETRLILSTIPQGNKESLQVLLRSAFDAGFGHGGADILMSFMNSMMRKSGE